MTARPLGLCICRADGRGRLHVAVPEADAALCGRTVVAHMLAGRAVPLGRVCRDCRRRTPALAPARAT